MWSFGFRPLASGQEFWIFPRRNGRLLDTGKRLETWKIAPGEIKAVDPIIIKTEEL